MTGLAAFARHAPLALTLAAALTGGAVFQAIKAPIPWTLGPLTAVMLLRPVAPWPLVWPGYLRGMAFAVLGSIIGSSFTPEVAARIMGQLAAMLAMTVAMTAFCLVLGALAARGGGFDWPSGVMGTVPGGLSQMAPLCEEIGIGDVTIVTFLQTTRVLSVVFLVPFLTFHGLTGAGPAAGAGVGTPAVLREAPDLSLRTLLFIIAVIAGVPAARRLRLPNAWMLGPLLLTAGLTYNGLIPLRLPPPLITAAQLCIGTYLGLSLRPEKLQNWRAILPYTMLSGVALVGFSFLLAYAMSLSGNFDLTTAFLSAAPGGMAEMAITAVAVGADLSTVAAYQLFRLLFILLVFIPLLRWWLRQRGASQRAAG